jgi:hypothetical protein
MGTRFAAFAAFAHFAILARSTIFAVFTVSTVCAGSTDQRPVVVAKAAFGRRNVKAISFL